MAEEDTHEGRTPYLYASPGYVPRFCSQLTETETNLIIERTRSARLVEHGADLSAVTVDELDVVETAIHAGYVPSSAGLQAAVEAFQLQSLWMVGNAMLSDAPCGAHWLAEGYVTEWAWVAERAKEYGELHAGICRSLAPKVESTVVVES